MNEVNLGMPPIHEVHVLGSKLSLCSLERLFQMITYWIETQHAALVLYGNLHSLNLAYEQPWLRDFINRADVVQLDGEGARLAAKLMLRQSCRTTIPVPPRTTWADFGWQLAAFCADHNYSLYLLGSAPGIAHRAAAALQARYPALQIAGTHHGYFDMQEGSADNEAVLAQIRAAKPDILIVGFGMPRQEKWLLQNQARLPACIAWGEGAAFDYISGNLSRGPRCMTAHGFEWLARLLIQPRHLWRRYLIGLPLFWLRFLREFYLLISRSRKSQ